MYLSLTVLPCDALCGLRQSAEVGQWPSIFGWFSTSPAVY